jgi:hypothetical protein
MPTEDPRRDGWKRDGLRVGGWLETLQGRRALPSRPPLVTPPPPRVPVFRPLRPRDPQRRPIGRPVARLAGVEHPRQVRLRIALTCLAVTAVGGAAFLVLADRAGTAPPLQQLAVADPVTLGPMPQPSTSSPAPAKVPVSPPASRASATSTATLARHAPDVVHHTTTPPARPVVIGGLQVGSTVSLQAQWHSQSRHPDGVMVLGSYVVRSAPTGGCVAFESAGQPGSFLRQRDFVVQLDRTDGSAQFRLDSAFCPVPAGDGSFRLRSADFPDRFLTAGRGGLYLMPVPADRATEFTAG